MINYVQHPFGVADETVFVDDRQGDGLSDEEIDDVDKSEEDLVNLRDSLLEQRRKVRSDLFRAQIKHNRDLLDQERQELFNFVRGTVRTDTVESDDLPHPPTATMTTGKMADSDSRIRAAEVTAFFLGLFDTFRQVQRMNEPSSHVGDQPPLLVSDSVSLSSVTRHSTPEQNVMNVKKVDDHDTMDASISVDGDDSSSTEGDVSSSVDGDDSDVSGNGASKFKKGKSCRSSKKKRVKQRTRSSKVTNEVRHIDERELWPQEGLRYSAEVDESYYLSYENLDLSLFVAGYTNNLSKSAASVHEHKLKHLEMLMYFSRRYKWRACLEYNAAVLLAIDKGMKDWGDSFTDLEYFLTRDTATQAEVSNQSGASTSESDDSSVHFSHNIWYCNRFNKGKCSMGNSHSQYFFKSGITRTVEHICANCLSLDGSREAHSYVNCPRRPVFS